MELSLCLMEVILYTQKSWVQSVWFYVFLLILTFKTNETVLEVSSTKRSTLSTRNIECKVQHMSCVHHCRKEMA